MTTAQLGTRFHAVVPIRSAGGEEHTKSAEEQLEMVALVAQAREQTRVKIAGGRVKGAVERLLVLLQRIPVLLGEPLADVDGLEAGGRGNREVDLGCCAHVGSKLKVRSRFDASRPCPPRAAPFRKPACSTT